MQYSTMGFIGTLKPMHHRRFSYDLVDPISGASYGWVFEFGPITILKVMGWHGEKLSVVKIFQKEFVW